MSSNFLRNVREREGLSRAALARLAELSDRTVQRVEAGQLASPATRGKLVKALNRLPTRLQDYETEDLFPTDAAQPGGLGEPQRDA